MNECKIEPHGLALRRKARKITVWTRARTLKELSNAIPVRMVQSVCANPGMASPVAASMMATDRAVDGSIESQKKATPGR